MIEPSHKIQFHVQVVPAPAVLLEHDTVPVMQQCFPKPIKTQTSFSGHPIEVLPMELSLLDRVLHNTAPIFNMSAHAISSAQEYYTDGKHVIYEEWSWTICSCPEKILYYHSEGLQRIESPPTTSSYYSHGLVYGHLFVHKYSSKPDIQTWIWNGTSWSSITTGCKHPSLANYKFNTCEWETYIKQLGSMEFNCLSSPGFECHWVTKPSLVHSIGQCMHTAWLHIMRDNFSAYALALDFKDTTTLLSGFMFRQGHQYNCDSEEVVGDTCKQSCGPCGPFDGLGTVDIEGDTDPLVSDENWGPHAIIGFLKSYLWELPDSMLTHEEAVHEFLSADTTAPPAPPELRTDSREGTSNYIAIDRQGLAVVDGDIEQISGYYYRK
ncbi:hypothetical protein BD769DRAFT_1394462 [Suillus cothurnatus]|nr:hypothetical protein BD769DRAFT_1394462 [Suillus cothurnatus]